MPVEMALKKNPKVVYRDLRDGAGGVVLHLESGQYHSLNGVAVAMWDLIDGSRSVGQITDEIRRRYPDAPGDLLEIVRGFCEGLRDRDLISME
jgi:coenzyme PQQ synthesis protein D (PqqD)